MPRTGWRLGLAVAAIWFGACDAGETTDGADPEARGIDEDGFGANGFRLNGFRLNGFRLNGFRLNGALLAGENGDSIALAEIRFGKGAKQKGPKKKGAKDKDPQVASSWLVDGDLHVKTEFGEVFSGQQLVGAELVFEVHEGEEATTKTVKVVAVEPLEVDPDIWAYDLEIRGKKGPWQPLCVDGLGAPTETILLAGVWDLVTGDRITPAPSSAVTFACRTAALAKCVEWGYVPWDSVDGVSLADHHQACTRASRADYCGDGVPHTIDGVIIHVLDELGIQEEGDGDYLVEAEWGPDGAVCLNAANTRLPNPAIACAPPPCGVPFAAGGLIQTGKPVTP